MSSRLICLLPARNAAVDLPAYFESVARFADGIVALDDGSTDATSNLLAAEPLVKIRLANPPRPDYRGWDDAANRNRLLTAAAALAPTWILSLDADERIDADDGAAMRRFLETDALPGCAYGFQLLRLREDPTHYDPEALWVYRLFAYEPGQLFPDQRLHFVPIPTTIPRQLWVQTTLRIQHLAALNEDRRRARFAKYRESDPNNEFQHSYRDLLSEPATVLPWPARPPDLPVLSAPFEPDVDGQDDDEPEVASADTARMGTRPVLSVVVIARDETEWLARSLAAIAGQECPEPFETITVISGNDSERTAELMRARFPEVQVVALPRPVLPGAARNAGLRLARGDYVTFPGSHVELLPGSLEARLRAHQRGYALVTGATINGTLTRAGWASYFLDQSAVLPGRPSGPFRGAPGHCSYSCRPLVALGGFPEDLRAGEDTVVNQALVGQGYIAYYDQAAAFIHHSPCRTPRRLLDHHFRRGRSYGQILRRQSIGQPRRQALRRHLSPAQVVSRLLTTHRHVRAWGGELTPEYSRSWPLVAAGAFAFWLGGCWEMLRADTDRTAAAARASAARSLETSD